MSNQSVTVDVRAVEPRIGTIYPPEHAASCQAREKRILGDLFGLSQFGVNLATLPPGCWSSLRHWHENEDEFVYVIEGELTLIDDAGEHVLKPGMCAGFKAGISNGHHLVNKSGKPATYLEVGTRAPHEGTVYPDVDMQAVKEGGAWKFLYKDGRPY